MNPIQSPLTHIQITPTQHSFNPSQTHHHSISTFYPLFRCCISQTSHQPITTQDIRPLLSPVLWNNLPQHLCAFSPHYIAQTNEQPLLLSQSQFLSQLKTHLFLQSHPPLTQIFWTDNMVNLTGYSRLILISSSHHLIHHYIFFFGQSVLE